MTTSSMARFCSTSASTRRSPAAVAGKIGAKATNLSSISICPLMPLTPEMEMRYQLSSPREAKQTFCDGSLDIEEGDDLVVAGTTYIVRSVAEWPGDNAFLHLVVEQVKGT